MKMKETMQRPRLLVLAPRYPYPVVGGDRLRIYYLCRELSRRYSLTLLSLCDSRSEMEAAAPKDGVFDRIERVYLPKWQSVLNVLAALPTSTPLQVAYYRSGVFGKKIRELLPEHDICVAHLIRTGDYIRESSGVLKILEMTDAISLNYQRVRSLGKKRNFKSWVYSVEASRLLAYERKVIHDFDLVTLVSDTDRDFLLQGNPAKHVLVCSNGVDLTSFPYIERKSTKLVLAFIGNITSVQNLDACWHFIEDIMPALSARFDVTFRVVGKINQADADRLKNLPNVEVTGRVDSVAAAVSDACIGVCPVRIGAGVQNKVLEYMALGLPTITSSIGLEGFSARPGSDLLVADTHAEYVEQVFKLWSEPEFALRIARNGRRYVEENHDWIPRLAPLAEAIEARIHGVDASAVTSQVVEC